MGVLPEQLLAGRYRVGTLLGTGGSACVFDGYDTRLKRPVAIKQLRPELADDAAMRRRFDQEARTAAKLIHPNVVKVYDAGVDSGLPYLVMERLPGRTLADRVAEGPLSPVEAAGMAADVLAALQAAHHVGLVHRDIKPGNILLTEDGTAKLADFGIAKSLEPSQGGDATRRDLTAMGLVIGTPAYLTPERLAGRPATARTDLYAVGVVLFEALTGRKPVVGETEVPGAPPALAQVVRRALSPSVAERYASAASMAAALRTARHSLSQTATAQPALDALWATSVVGADRRAKPSTVHRTQGVPAAAAGRRAAGRGVAPGARRRATRGQRSTNRHRPVVLASVVGVAAIGIAAIVLAGGLMRYPTRTSSTQHLRAGQSVTPSVKAASTTPTTALAARSDSPAAKTAAAVLSPSTTASPAGGRADNAQGVSGASTASGAPSSSAKGAGTPGGSPSTGTGPAGSSTPPTATSGTSSTPPTSTSPGGSTTPPSGTAPGGSSTPPAGTSPGSGSTPPASTSPGGSSTPPAAPSGPGSGGTST